MAKKGKYHGRLSYTAERRGYRESLKYSKNPANDIMDSFVTVLEFYVYNFPDPRFQDAVESIAGTFALYLERYGLVCFEDIEVFFEECGFDDETAKRLAWTHVECLKQFKRETGKWPESRAEVLELHEAKS